MTKAGLTTAISTALSIVITKIKVLASLGNIVDNLYPPTITELYTNLATTNTNTTPIGTTHYYNSFWKKQGNIVHVKGTITNKTGSSVSNTDWFNIDAGEFTPASLGSIDALKFHGRSLSDNRNVLMQINSTAIKLIGTIANNETILIDFKYFTE